MQANGGRVPAPRGDDDLSRLARWYDESGPSRTLNPWSPVTVLERVGELIAINNEPALAEAYRLLPGDPLVLAAEAQRLVAAAGPGDQARAHWYAVLAGRHVDRNVPADPLSARRRKAEIHARLALVWRQLAARAPDASASAQQAARKNINLKDMLAMPTYGGYQLSPDGKWVLFTRGDRDLKDYSTISHIWLHEVATGRTFQLTSHPKGESSPRFLPDGRVAFTSNRDTKNAWWAISPGGGEAAERWQVHRDRGSAPPF